MNPKICHDYKQKRRIATKATRRTYVAQTVSLRTQANSLRYKKGEPSQTF